METAAPGAFVIYAPITIAIISLIISGLSLWISRMNYRRSVLSEEPIASASIEPMGIAHPCWHRVTLRVENRRPHAIRWNTITIRSPRGAVGMFERDGFAATMPNFPRVLMSDLPHELATTTIRIGSLIAKAGTEPSKFRGLSLSSGDRHSALLLVFVPPSRRSKILSIRLSLSSIEAVERETVIDIKRTLPQLISTAPASATRTH